MFVNRTSAIGRDKQSKVVVLRRVFHRQEKVLREEYRRNETAEYQILHERLLSTTLTLFSTDLENAASFYGGSTPSVTHKAVQQSQQSSDGSSRHSWISNTSPLTMLKNTEKHNNRVSLPMPETFTVCRSPKMALWHFYRSIVVHILPCKPISPY